MRVYTVLAIFLFFASCNTGENTQTEPGPNITSTANESGCYRYASNADTIILQLGQNGESITGTLVYNFKEKDKNIGTIDGKMKGDMLVANYKFMSEGMESIRQVAFKKRGDSFVEGYGEITMEGDKTVFKNQDSLNFNEAMKLNKIACP